MFVLLALNPGAAADRLENQLCRIGLGCRRIGQGEDRPRLAADVSGVGRTVALVDLEYRGGCGIEFCRQYPPLLKEIPVVFCGSSGKVTINRTVAAVRAGAADVIEFPVDSEQLHAILTTAADFRHCGFEPPYHPQARNGRLQNGSEMCPCCPGGTPPEKKGLIREGNGLLEVSSRREGPPAGAALLESMLIGSSSAIAAIRRLVLHVAGTEANVMIHGESGTGKEVVARAIHLLSNRSQGPFVPVNMAAIPPGLAESLLFGHDMGSFTGAHQAQPGWCRVADGGTLFLDEIAEMELQVQPKLLRFLQEGTIQAVGAPSFDRLDVRIVTATNRDPRRAVAEGALREDLFFRLHVIPISIPPLRERREDIAELAAVFLRSASARHQRLARVFSADALEVLRSFEWPGNIRQLENAVERVVILAQDEVIEASDIPAEFQSPEDSVSSGGGREHQSDGLGGGAVPSAADLRDMTRYQRQERAMILQALQQTGGHVVEAARLLGLGQATVYRKIKRYAISRNSASRSKLRQPI